MHGWWCVRLWVHAGDHYRIAPGLSLGLSAVICVEFLHEETLWGGSGSNLTPLVFNILSCIDSIAQEAVTSLWLEEGLFPHRRGRLRWIWSKNALARWLKVLVCLHGTLIGERDDVTIVQHVSVFEIGACLFELLKSGVDLGGSLV